MPSSRAYPTLERKPGKQNWVDRAGGLPNYIERIAKHLHYEKGMSISRAIAVAVNVAKRMAATGDLNFPGVQQVNAGSRAEAVKAVAQWEAKKARSGKRRKGGSVNTSTIGQPAFNLAWDGSKHPRGKKGDPNGGQFVPLGKARNAKAEQAVRKGGEKAKANYRGVQTGKVKLGQLSDTDLQNLCRVVYSSRTSDPKVVAARTKVAAEMSRRGFDIKDFGALGGGITDSDHGKRGSSNNSGGKASGRATGGRKREAKTRERRETVQERKREAKARERREAKLSVLHLAEPPNKDDASSGGRKLSDLSDAALRTLARAVFAEMRNRKLTVAATGSKTPGGKGGPPKTPAKGKPANLSVQLAVSPELRAKPRRKAADQGHALPDGSFPIRNRSELAKAIQAFGRAKDKPAAKRHILKRARKLGASDKVLARIRALGSSGKPKAAA